MMNYYLYQRSDFAPYIVFSVLNDFSFFLPEHELPSLGAAKSLPSHAHRPWLANHRKTNSGKNKIWAGILNFLNNKRGRLDNE